MALRSVLPAVVMAVLSGPSAAAQEPGAPPAEQVSYLNPHDGTRLGAWLSLPGASGPHPAVVVLSIAGTAPLVDGLVSAGYAVLTPERRGFVDVEPLLRATYADLARDARAALDYLRSRDDVDGGAVALVAQADDAPPAMLTAVEDGVPLVLFAPPAFSGVESFRLEQRGAALRDRAGPDELAALDRYVDGIAAIVLGESEGYVRAYRLGSLRAGSPVQLPRSAAFPSDERQMHFFASPLWHDRLAFQPEAVLAGLRSPVLVLIGAEDANTPLDAYLLALRRGLQSASTSDATVCVLPGRTRHVFTEDGVRVVTEWMRGRVGAASEDVRGRDAAGRHSPGCEDRASDARTPVGRQQGQPEGREDHVDGRTRHLSRTIVVAALGRPPLLGRHPRSARGWMDG